MYCMYTSDAFDKTGYYPPPLSYRYTIFKDHISLADYEIHDGMNLELYYQ